MPRKIRVGAVGWIDPAGPWPIRPGNSARAEADQMKAGLQDNSNGIVRTYMGLMATTNTAPATTLNFAALQKTKDFRAIVWADLLYDEPAPGAVAAANVRYAGPPATAMIVDPGFTPPVDMTKVAAMGLIPSFTDAGKHVRDRTWYAAEASPVSSICLGARHPNSVLRGSGRGEAVIANGLIRFRAGPHTDQVGMEDANAQYHVPWVWVEILLTSIGRGQVRLYGASSQFPTVAWYLDDKRVGAPHAQTTDASFTFDWMNNIVTGSLRIWPVLQAGAPRGMGEPPLSSDAAYVGRQLRVTSLPYTSPGGAYLDVTASASPAAGAN